MSSERERRECSYLLLRSHGFEIVNCGLASVAKAIRCKGSAAGLNSRKFGADNPYPIATIFIRQG
jgi:hypothetical protein